MSIEIGATIEQEAQRRHVVIATTGPKSRRPTFVIHRIDVEIISWRMEERERYVMTRSY